MKFRIVALVMALMASGFPAKSFDYNDSLAYRVALVQAYVNTCPSVRTTPKFRSATLNLAEHNQNARSNFEAYYRGIITDLQSLTVSGICAEALSNFGKSGSQGTEWLEISDLRTAYFEAMSDGDDIESRDPIHITLERLAMTSFITIECPLELNIPEYGQLLKKNFITENDILWGGRLTHSFYARVLSAQKWLDVTQTHGQTLCQYGKDRFGKGGWDYPNLLHEK